MFWCSGFCHVAGERTAKRETGQTRVNQRFACHTCCWRRNVRQWWQYQRSNSTTVGRSRQIGMIYVCARFKVCTLYREGERESLDTGMWYIFLAVVHNKAGKRMVCRHCFLPSLLIKRLQLCTLYTWNHESFEWSIIETVYQHTCSTRYTQ